MHNGDGEGKLEVQRAIRGDCSLLSVPFERLPPRLGLSSGDFSFKREGKFLALHYYTKFSMMNLRWKCQDT